MEDKSSMNSELTTEQVQDEIYKKTIQELRRSRGLDLEEAVKKVNTTFTE